MRKNRQKTIARLALKFSLLIYLTMVNQVNANNKEPACHLNYAWAQVPPYIIAGSPEPSGFQVDLLRWIASELDCHINFVEMNWQQSLHNLKTGQIDLVGRSSFNSDRNQFAYFSDAYATEVLVLYLRKGEKKQYAGADLNDLLKNDFRLGLLKGAYYGREIEMILQSPEMSQAIQLYPFAEDMIVALEQNKIDGFFEAPYIMDNAAMAKRMKLGVEEYPVEIVTGDIHFMFSKSSVSKKLVKRFNLALAKVKESNRYLSHRYWSKVR